jgi:hypothetical protein
VRPSDFPEAQVRIVIVKGLPLDHFENVHVQRSYYCLLPPNDPAVPFLTERAISKRIKQMRIESEMEIARRLNQTPSAKVALQVDGWSTRLNRAGFLGVVAHWIDLTMEWHEELVGFVPTNGKHKGAELASLVHEVIDNFDITPRLSSITVDNASSNGTMIKEINAALETILPDTVTRFPCVSHVFQLSQGDLLGGLDCKPTNEAINFDISVGELEAMKYTDKSARGRRAQSTQPRRGPEKYGAIPWTLHKVYICDSTRDSAPY